MIISFLLFFQIHVHTLWYRFRWPWLIWNRFPSKGHVSYFKKQHSSYSFILSIFFFLSVIDSCVNAIFFKINRTLRKDNKSKLVLSNLVTQTFWYYHEMTQSIQSRCRERCERKSKDFYLQIKSKLTRIIRNYNFC